ncbi:MAG: NAD(P)H-hydrate dehydratase [Salinivirgaceae bacterium]|jgi:NAD(P)H-hydrate epimerase
MKILTVEQIRQADAFTITNEPIPSIQLMERAANELFKWIKKHYLVSQPIYLFAGNGNNGGDALALARLLYMGGFTSIQVFVLTISEKLTADCETNLHSVHELGEIPVNYLNESDEFPFIPEDAVIIDGIFGSGLSRSVTGYWAQLIDWINRNATEIVAIDIPSGLSSDAPFCLGGAVVEADFTLTFQVPKLAFMFAENYQYVGEWILLDIGLHPDYMNSVETNYELFGLGEAKKLLKPRQKFSHKGIYGHGLLIAGSYQKTGAAILSARACLSSGIGLLTVHVPQSSYQILQTAVPEAMLHIDDTELEYCSAASLKPYGTIGIGPGIGTKPAIQNAFRNLMENHKKPMVIDADAINILAENPNWLDRVPLNSILTPHPGEFDRLTHAHDSGYSRMQTQLEFSKKHQVIIVLKGANTSITDPEGKIYFNSTGNPGMATGGSGDVLTGIILSLLAQKYQPLDAALLGVYLHGLAGDIASQKVGEDSLIASDIIKCLGKAFLTLKE